MIDKMSLKQMRTYRNFSQEFVSNKIPISREHLGRLESDTETLRKAKINTVLQLLSLYEFSIDQLIFFEE